MPWYANQQIRQGGVLAYDVGHRVPDTNVERHGYEADGLVTWVEPGEHFEGQPEPSLLTGTFPNAPVQPDAPVEEGTRVPAADEDVEVADRTTDDVGNPPAITVPPAVAKKTPPSDGDDTSKKG